MSGEDAGTIAAVATAPGRGGIGIVRISGERALPVAEAIFRRRGGGAIAAAPPWTLLLGRVLDPLTGEPLDEALAVRMPPGRSYTGEDTVEIHGHGGPAILDAILGAALAAGARPAGPGEFTRRAFLGGRIDLAQAEAVAELIAADSRSGRLEALDRLGGGAGRSLAGIRRTMVELIARVEAQIEFSEEEGIDEGFPDVELQALGAQLSGLASAGQQARRGDRRPRVVIVGRANSGKSSLFNYLHGEERAVVTAQPGTTRDFIEAGAVVSGCEILLVDTAGVRAAECEAERIGIRRALDQVAGADLLLHLVDGSAPLEETDRRVAALIRNERRVLVATKADLDPSPGPSELASLAGAAPLHQISVLTGAGCPQLAESMAGFLAAVREPGEKGAPTLNCRQAEALGRSSRLVGAARAAGATPAGIDRAAEDLRGALAALDEVTGAGVAGEVLEEIFSRFCVGK